MRGRTVCVEVILLEQAKMEKYSHQNMFAKTYCDTQAGFQGYYALLWLLLELPGKTGGYAC